MKQPTISMKLSGILASSQLFTSSSIVLNVPYLNYLGVWAKGFFDNHYNKTEQNVEDFGIQY